MQSDNFFTNETILATLGYKRIKASQDQIDNYKEEKRIDYCYKCGWPMGNEYEKSIGQHVECKEII